MKIRGESGDVFLADLAAAGEYVGDRRAGDAGGSSDFGSGYLPDVPSRRLVVDVLLLTSFPHGDAALDGEIHDATVVCVPP